jgi:sulfopyruvate decarboxylase TPP-binding subunit
MGRAVRTILESIGIRHVTVESGATASDTVEHAGTQAFASRVSCACLLPKVLTANQPDRDRIAIGSRSDLNRITGRS